MKNSRGNASVVVHSRMLMSHVGLSDDLSETEITTQLTVPRDGGWAWIVLACSFVSMGLLDGTAFTFGSLLGDMVRDLRHSEPVVATVNSITIAVFYLAGPLASAVINRFGFRLTGMFGASFACLSLLVTYFMGSIYAIYATYGFCAGLGYSMINMSSILVVGFYFERYRAIALAVAQAGSGIGLFVLSALNTHLVDDYGWRLTVLSQCVIMVIEIFLALAYRPLPTVSVATPTRTVTFLPNVSQRRLSDGEVHSTAAERIFRAAANANYPTAADVVEETTAAPTRNPEPPTQSSATPVKGYSATEYVIEPQDTPKANNPGNQNTSFHDGRSIGTRLRVSEVTRETSQGPSRPMYRDDAFYAGPMSRLPQYEKSTTNAADRDRADLEYQLAVTRAMSTKELSERIGLRSTAVRRVLATMLDPSLLKRPSFILICLSAFSCFVGLLVPMVFLQERNRKMGIAEDHVALFISAMGLATCSGRLTVGFLANYNVVDPTILTWVGLLVSSIATALSFLSYSALYQCFYSVMFGFFIGGSISLRAIMLVSLYGLDKLTNAMGMILLFQGFGSLISAPMGGVIIVEFGYTMCFIVAGVIIGVSAIPKVMPVKTLVRRENAKLEGDD